jgi:hypothetical protein
MGIEPTYPAWKAGGEKKAEKGSTGGALYLLCSYAYESDVSGKNTDGY